MMRYLGYALILVALLTGSVWAFSQFVQPVLPSGVNSSLILLITALLSVVGFLAAFRDTVELVQLFKRQPQLERMKPTDLFQNISPEDLRDRLRAGGKVPWVNRGVTNVSLLMRSRRIAIIGNGGVGKSREAVELISQALSEDLFTPESIFEFSSDYHYMRADVLENIHPFVALQQNSTLLVDDLPRLTPSTYDLGKLALFLRTFGLSKGPYVIITASEAQLSDQHINWLKENKFEIKRLKPMGPAAARQLVDGAAEEWGLALSNAERAILVQQTFGYPAAIILSLRRLLHKDRSELTTQSIYETSSHAIVDHWSNERSTIGQKYAIAEYVLDALGSFSSVGIPAYSQLVQAFAWFHWYREGGSIRDWRIEYPRLVQFLSQNFEIDLSGNVVNVDPFVAEVESIAIEKAQEDLADFLGSDNHWPRYERQLGIGCTRANRTSALILLASQREEIQSAERLFNMALQIGEIYETFFARGLFYWKHERNQLAMGDLERASALNPESMLIRLTLFSMHLHEGDFNSALSDLDLLRESTIDPRILTIQRATVLARRGEKDSARKLLDKLEIEADEVELLGERLRANLEANSWLAAVKDVGLSLDYIRQQPDTPQIIEITLLTDRAGYSFNAHKNQDVLTDVEEVLQLHPVNSKAIALRSMVRTRNEEFESALDDANLVMELDSAWGIEAREYLRSVASTVGLDYANSDNNDAALRSLNVSLRLDPNDSYDLAVRGQVLRKLGDYQRALQDLSRAIALDPPARKEHHQRGLVYTATGNFEAAILDFQAAGLPHHSFWEAGLVLIKTGRVEEGLQSFRDGVISVEANSLADSSIYDLLVLSVYHAGLDQFNMSRELIDKAFAKSNEWGKSSDVLRKYIGETIERLGELKGVFHDRTDGVDEITANLAAALDSLP